MNERHARNIAASVRQRLLNLAHERGMDFGLMLTNFAVERFLYRLSISPHERDFVVKGAVLFRVWSNEEFRPTRDLDMLAFGCSKLALVESTIRGICEIVCEEDGLAFSSESIRAEEIRRRMSSPVKQPRFLISEQFECLAHGRRWVYPDGIG